MKCELSGCRFAHRSQARDERGDGFAMHWHGAQGEFLGHEKDHKYESELRPFLLGAEKSSGSAKGVGTFGPLRTFVLLAANVRFPSFILKLHSLRLPADLVIRRHSFCICTVG